MKNKILFQPDLCLQKEMRLKMEIIEQTDLEYPSKLLEIQNPPKQLYVEGNAKLLNMPSIAIVGSRKATEYGKKYAGIFAKKIAKAGICIASGMAIGIDGVAHMYSMKEKGKTIAVLGSGFNNIYPKENYYLYKKILENEGCVITEFPPETKANMANFPRRNRIISGLSMGVLVVEARKRSGSTITAHYALKQNKEVFCIPNRLGEKTGYSPNLLIKDGANLVTCPEDILEFYEEFKEENTKLYQEYQEIYDFIGDMPISANELAKLTNKTIAEITEGLCMLELDGLITNVPGNKYVRNKK